jgi:hypothetical protein
MSSSESEIIYFTTVQYDGIVPSVGFGGAQFVSFPINAKRRPHASQKPEWKR